MSPEQVTGERELDGRSDIYALGCVLYEMLTGTPPFKGPTAQSILLRHLSDPAPSVRATRPDIPDTVDQALATALVKDPLRRCPSAAEFAAMLERFQMSSIAVRGLPNPRLSVSAERPRPRFVAVLPFQNMSADSDNESGSPKTSSRSCRKSGT
jgi:serine/threonine-protein kinase